MPRLPPGEAEEKGGRKKTIASSTGGSVAAGMGVIDLAGIGLDQQLIIHAYNSAIVATTTMVINTFLCQSTD